MEEDFSMGFLMFVGVKHLIQITVNPFFSFITVGPRKEGKFHVQFPKAFAHPAETPCVMRATFVLWVVDVLTISHFDCCFRFKCTFSKRKQKLVRIINFFQ